MLVELADGVAFAEGLRDADGVALGEALALAPGTGVVVAPYGSYSSTWRNMSSAVELTSSMVCCEPLPGTVTTSRFGPCGWTCAPELPVPLTRDSMTPTAAFISSVDGAFPVRVCARKVTWVPLDRSRPSPTLNLCSHWLGANSFGPSTPSSMATMRTSKRTRARPGCGTVLDGAATSPPVLDPPFPVNPHAGRRLSARCPCRTWPDRRESP